MTRPRAYTGAYQVQDYVLLKAAETIIQAGGSHFAVSNVADQTSIAAGQTPGTIQTNLIGQRNRVSADTSSRDGQIVVPISVDAVSRKVC